jgi:ABC-type multidrug transport system fused ATPase/permease subunit
MLTFGLGWAKRRRRPYSMSSAVRPSMWRLLRGHRSVLTGLAAMALLGGFAESVMLVVIVEAAVALTTQHPESFAVGPISLNGLHVSFLLAVALAAIVLRFCLGLGLAWGSASLTAKIQTELRLALFRTYIDADWPTQSSEREGRLQQIVGLEVDRIAVAVLLLVSGLAAACSLVVLVGAALIINPLAAGALAAAVCGLFLVLRPLTRRVRRLANARSAEELGMAQSLNELVRTAEEIRVHGVGDEEKRRLGVETTQVSAWITRINFSNLSISNVYQASALGLIVLALFIVEEFGTADVAATGTIVLILLRALAYSQQVQQAYHQVSERLTSLGAVDDRLSSYRSAAPVVGEAALAEIDRLDFCDVSYSYKVGYKAVDTISFSVSRGEVVGVVGPSGAGKSTLVQLLLRLRPPDEGHYFVNGRDASDFAASDWSRLVSFLPQEPKLIASSVRENIRFLRDVDNGGIEDAARVAHLHDEILSWSDGYETVIGPRADAISGGQAQRLCLARALVSHPALLILDEPTSALDPLSEHYVQKALDTLRGETTIFIIAHRLSTLSICDRILVLMDGRLEAMETREHLASHSGFYQDALRLSGLL